MHRMGGFAKTMLVGAIVLAAGEIPGCAHRTRQPEVALVAFEFEGQKYRLRSIYWAGEGESFNELIGPGFVARDQNQDGVIDAVVLGECSLAEAQRIYEHVISTLASQNRVRRVEPGNFVYRYEAEGLRYQIKTVEVVGKGYVNEFRVTRAELLAAPELTVALDAGADGQLDEVIKGSLPLSEAQRMYAASIERGVREKRLVRADSLVLVRK